MEPSARAEFNNQEFLSPEIEDLCHTKNLSIIAYSPLLEGFYSRKEAALPALYQNAVNEERLVSLRNTSSETRLSPTQLILAWMVSHSPQVIPLLGCSSSSQLKENLVAVTTSLDPEVIQKLQ
jgi:aryl-alcohol dehydrogenase-like predicted oxidoreductase